MGGVAFYKELGEQWFKELKTDVQVAGQRPTLSSG